MGRSKSSSTGAATAATSVIVGFDHVVIAVRDCAAGAAAYETLLGRTAHGVETNDGVSTAVVAAGNIAVELMAPAGETEMAQRLRAALDEGGEGLKSIVFAVGDIARMHRRAERVGLEPDAIKQGRSWRSFRADGKRTHGVRLFFLQREAGQMRDDGDAAAAAGLDHIVIRTADMDRAAALYGARLGLDMRLDREVAGRRLMFFRCGDAIVEIAHDRGLGGEDCVWGLSWRVRDAEAARARLAASGMDVSEVRDGMKPGTRVFTVRSGACGVPTLMIEPAPERD